MEVVLLLVIVVGVILIYRANRSAVPVDSIKSDIDTVVRGTAKSAGKAGAFVQRAVQQAKQTYQENRVHVPVTTTQNDTVDTRLAKYQALDRLKTLLDNGTITHDEFEVEKRKLLDSKLSKRGGVGRP